MLYSSIWRSSWACRKQLISAKVTFLGTGAVVKATSALGSLPTSRMDVSVLTSGIFWTLGTACAHRRTVWGCGTPAVHNNNNTPINSTFVTAMVKGGTNGFAIKGGDATLGGLKTLYDGSRPPGYQPMRKQGAISEWLPMNQQKPW